MIVSHRDVETKEIEEKALEAEPNLDQMTRHVQNLFKFKNFYY